MKILKFNEWEAKNGSVEESLIGDVSNWLSRNFGGKIKKIDSIISDLIYAEKQYAKDWEKIQHQISSMNSQIETEEITEEEEEDFKKKIKEGEQKIETALRKKTQTIRELNVEAMKLVQGNPKVHKYWDLKKAEAELSVIENLYNISKSLPDKKLEDSLFSQYKKALERYNTKQSGFEKIEKEIEKEEPSGDKEEVKIGKLVSMSISDFKKEIKKYSAEQRRSIQKMLIDQKNLGLNELRSLRRTKSKELDKVSDKDKNRVTSKYNPLIYEVGERIDRIREKINHIND